LVLSIIGNVGIGIDDPYTELHVNGKLKVNAGQVAPPSFGTSGGIGDGIICWNGTSSSHPFSLGIDDSTLWFSVSGNCFHKFCIGGVTPINMNSVGLAIVVNSALYPLHVSTSQWSTSATKRCISLSGSLPSTTEIVLVCANFSENI
jgi:hypothetical protein